MVVEVMVCNTCSEDMGKCSFTNVIADFDLGSYKERCLVGPQCRGVKITTMMGL